MNKTLVGLIIVVVVIIGGGVYFATRQTVTPTVQTPAIAIPTPQAAVKESTEAGKIQTQTFDNIKTPHFVSSEPANNAVLTISPSQVKINFNFDLAENSKILVTVNGNEVTTAVGTKISADKFSMTTLVNPIASANYKVNYTACWPDGSCHDGSFGFTVQP